MNKPQTRLCATYFRLFTSEGNKKGGIKMCS
jgi:hypothetical protein